MKVLFVCNQGQNRSRTAAELFNKEFETKYTGLYSSTPLTHKEIEWADLIVVMEDSQRKEIGKRFPKQYMRTRIVSLDIADFYYYTQPELIVLLKQKMKELLEPLLE